MHTVLLLVMGAAIASCSALFFARPIGRFLLAIADARDTFRASWKNQPAATPRKSVSTAKQPTIMLDSIQRDVVSALVNLRMAKKDAEAIVASIGSSTDFETLFRHAQSVIGSRKAV